MSRASKTRRGASQWAVAWRRFKKNKAGLSGMFMVGTLIFVALFGGFLASYPGRPNPGALKPLYDGEASEPPSWKHPFGTASVGYDVFSEVVHAAKYTLYVGFVATLITMGLAILVGSVAGYFGRATDDVLMRVAEVFLVFPTLPLILAFTRVYLVAAGTTYWNILGINVPVGLTIVIAILGAFGWAGNARLIRGEFLRVRELDFVKAEKALGADSKRIIFRHVLPNILSPVIVVSTLTVAYAILSEAGISFLGFGDPNAITWGQMMQESFIDIRIAWWTEIFPGLAVLWSVFGFNLLGDGLADALNPRLRE